MLDELDVKHEIPLALLTLSLREIAAASLTIIVVSLDCNRNQLMLTSSTAGLWILIALFAQVVIWARVAVIAFSTENFAVANDALLHKLWCVAIV